MLQAIPLIQQPTVAPAVWTAKTRLTSIVQFHGVKSFEARIAAEEYAAAMNAASEEDKKEYKRLDKLHNETVANEKARKQAEEKRVLEEMVRHINSLKLKC